MFPFPVRYILTVMIAVVIQQSVYIHAQDVMNLAGDWDVVLDREDSFVPSLEAPSIPLHPAKLPGSLGDSSLGDAIGPNTVWIGTFKKNLWDLEKYAPYHRPEDYRIPFWWQPSLRYLGRAWYSREVTIPDTWEKQSIDLVLERPHWQTQIYVDNVKVGSGESLSVPHVFDLTSSLTPGKHKLWICVDNRIANLDVGENSHSVSDHTQTAWNGIVGKLELRASPLVSICSIQLQPDSDGRTVRVQMELRNQTRAVMQETVQFVVSQNKHVLGEKKFGLTVPLGRTIQTHLLRLDHPLESWDEFEPRLGEISANLMSQSGPLYRQRFGHRPVSTEDGHIALNSKPIFLRGTLECCVFPMTGYPATDIDSWKRILRICKEHGLNHLRFHSWCPPEAAFVAADELGFYYQIECSSWPNQSTELGVGKPVDEWLYREADRILAAYGNHPSFLMLSAGNEPQGPDQGIAFLSRWVEHCKKKAPSILVTSASGWPEAENIDFLVTPEPRTQQWQNQLQSRLNVQTPNTMVDYQQFTTRYSIPIVSHEIGQWCAFPNLDEEKKYTGLIQLKNYGIFRDFLNHSHMLDQAHDFVMASGRLQTLIYKEEIESALRTPRFGGFQLLDLRDFPGQGTATVGVLDPFWDPKPYTKTADFRRFCGPIVPLARFAKRVWTSDEMFRASVELAHYGPVSLNSNRPRWRLSDNANMIAEGELPSQNIAASGLRPLGEIAQSLDSIAKPTRLKLTVSIDTDDTVVANDWDIWVYPKMQHATRINSQVTLAHELTPAVISRLNAGAKVLLLADPKWIETTTRIGFTPIFWNTAWTDNQPPHTLGILCDPKHSALQGFVTDEHSDWQWWGLINRSAAMDLSQLPPSFRPIVQAIPDWHDPKRLGLLIEAKVGEGRLLICSIDLEEDIDNRPEAKQFLHSLTTYVESENFRPDHELTTEQVRTLLRSRPNLNRLNARITSDNVQPGYGVENLLDGNSATIWHSQWSVDSRKLPTQLTVDLREVTAIAGIKCLPRSDNPYGRIAQFHILVSHDGQEWTEVSSGQWDNDAKWKFVHFDRNIDTRYLMLIAEREFDGNLFASLAELDVILPNIPEALP